MEESLRIDHALESGLHEFNGRKVIVKYIEDDGDWAVINIEDGTFIASSPFSATEAMMNAEWLAGGPIKMETYIAQLLQKASNTPLKRLPIEMK